MEFWGLVFIIMMMFGFERMMHFGKTNETANKAGKQVVNHFLSKWLK